MKTKVIVAAVVAIAAATTITVATTRGGARSTGVGSQLAKVRSATNGYHSVTAANSAGYEKLLDCFQSAEGGMGQHYVQKASLDAIVDRLAPEAMVYEVRADGQKLVAVEYIVPQKAWTQATPPTLFGQTFHRNDKLGLWALHAWIWRSNPKGMFADFNPNVTACPSA